MNFTVKKTPGITAKKFARVVFHPALGERKTASDYIADALRVAIYDGQFTDGEELNQVELGNYFKVSRAPVREALRRLQAEGLISSVAHRRAVVIGLELDEITELLEIRAIIEGHLVEKAGPHITTASLRRLDHLCDEMEIISDYDYDWVKKNWEFHGALYGPSGSKIAIALVEQYHQKVERYVRRTGSVERLRRAVVEHRQILSEVQNEQFSAARSKIQEHIMHTSEEIHRHFAASGKEPQT